MLSHEEDKDSFLDEDDNLQDLKFTAICILQNSLLENKEQIFIGILYAIKCTEVKIEIVLKSEIKDALKVCFEHTKSKKQFDIIDIGLDDKHHIVKFNNFNLEEITIENINYDKSLCEIAFQFLKKN